jgi:hypothetical protein
VIPRKHHGHEYGHPRIVQIETFPIATIIAKVIATGEKRGNEHPLEDMMMII